MWSKHARGPWLGTLTTGRIAILGLILLGLIANLFTFATSAGAATPGAVRLGGDNRSSHLGLTYNQTERAAPGAVTAATNGGITAIAASSAFSMALKSDGTVLSWGSNFPSGQLGQNSTQDRLDPGAVQGVGGVTAIAAGRTHALAVAGGTVFAWGSNVFGQVGATTSTNCNSGTCSRSATQ